MLSSTTVGLIDSLRIASLPTGDPESFARASGDALAELLRRTDQPRSNLDLNMEAACRVIKRRFNNLSATEVISLANEIARALHT